MAQTGSVPFKLYRPLALSASGDGVAVSTATGAVTLTWADEQFQNIDPGGAGRNVALPTPDPEHKGCFFVFYNAADAAETLTIKNGGSTVVAIGQGESAIVCATSATWKVALALPASTALPGTANTWDLLQTLTTGALIQDSGALKFGTPGTDVVYTANGTDVIVTATGDIVHNDSVDVYWGTGKDLRLYHNGTNSYVESVTGDLIIDNQLVTGNTYMDLGTDTSATSFGVRNNSGTVAFVVKGDGKTTTGNVRLGGIVDSPMTAAQVLAGSGTITLPTTGINKALSSASAVTGIILTAGTVAGQIIVLMNVNASDAITFDTTPATSNVAQSVCAINANTAKMFTWNATTSRWYPIG